MRVTPLVIVPRDNLNHVVAHDHGQGGIDRRRDVGASEIDGDQRSVGDGQDTLHRAVLGLSERRVDFFGGDALLLNVDNQIDDGNVRGRNSQRDTVQLTLQLRQDQRNRLGGAGGGRHNVQRRSARTSQISVRGIQDSLITSVGVSGGHGALDDAEAFVQNLGERRQAVSGARGVGDDVGRRVKLVRVDTNDVGRDVVTLGRGRDNNLLGTRGDVLASARAVEKDTGTFDDDVDAQFCPRQLQRVSGRDDLDALAIDGDVRVVDNLDVSLEGAQDGIVLDQVRGLLDTAGVVDGNNIEQGVLASAVPASQKVTADATEAVDGNLAGFALGFDGVADRRLREEKNRKM